MSETPPIQTFSNSEENILVVENIFDHGYGFAPQAVLRNKDLSIQAKGLYCYFASFAGAGGKAFPATKTILAELKLSKDSFYKYRKELVAWGFLVFETQATRFGKRTIYRLPANPQPTKAFIFCTSRLNSG